MTTVRLAVASSRTGWSDDNSTTGHGQQPNGTGGGLEMTTARLAVGGPISAIRTGLTPRQDGKGQPVPALLVSYVYLREFQRNQHDYTYRDWVMDSGAFSAHQSGTMIRLDDYIARCHLLLQSDKTLTEIFALDVIGDWKASLLNCEKMWQAGVQAIPCYHVGEPEHVLMSMARDYPKIALGGAVGYRGRDNWAKQCFSRVWPKKIHGFGFGSETSLMGVPFHSADASSWEAGPCRFGTWKAYGQMSVRNAKGRQLRAEVEWYLELERKLKWRWRKEMAQLDALP